MVVGYGASTPVTDEAAGYTGLMVLLIVLGLRKAWPRRLATEETDAQITKRLEREQRRDAWMISVFMLVLYIGGFLAALYIAVRFVKWAWTD